MSYRGKRSLVAVLAGTALSWAVPPAPAGAAPPVAGVCVLTLSTGNQALVPSTATPEVEQPWDVNGSGPCWVRTVEGPDADNPLTGTLTLNLTAVVGTGCLTAAAVGIGTFQLTRPDFPSSIGVVAVVAASGLLTVATVGVADRFVGAGVLAPDTALGCVPGPTSMAWTGKFVFGKVDPPLSATAG